MKLGQNNKNKDEHQTSMLNLATVNKTCIAILSLYLNKTGKTI